MIKKLYEDRRDDIIKARDEWEADYNRKKQVRDNQEQNYHMAQMYVEKYLEDQVLKAIGNTSLNITIRIDSYYGEGYRVHIYSDDYNKFDENVALSWDWKVALDSNGTIVRESNSYSGLKATTVEQLDSLEETLRVLKLLNNLDWKGILEDANKRRPNYRDYIDVSTPSRGDRPNFENQLKDEAVSNVIGKDVLVKGKTDGNWPKDTWFCIVGQTDKQYKVFEFSNYEVRRLEEEGKLSPYIKNYIKGTPTRITKDKLLASIPYDNETGEIDTKEF